MAIGGAIGLAFFSRQSLEATPHIEVALAWALMTGTTLIQIDGVRHQATLEGVGRIDVERLVLAAAYVLTFGCLIGVTIFTKSIVAMSMTWMVGTLVGRACLRMAVKRLLGRLPPPLPSADQRGVAMLGISFRVWLVSLGAAAAVHSQALSVGLFLGAAALPGYYLAHKMLEALTSSLAVVVQADRALLTQELAAGRFSSAYARVKRSTSIVATGAVVVTLCFSIWGKWIVTTWLRNPGAIDDVTVHLLALNAGFSIFTGLVGQLVLATGRNPFVPSVLAAGAINVTLLLVLVPALGIRGAALASLISGLMSSYPYNIYQGLKTLRAIRVGSR
jgi:O-antigen/teichoic acid export membrane protein